MANLDNLFLTFNNELSIPKQKKSKMIASKDHLREKIRAYFKKNHEDYVPQFYIQGSYKLKTTIRTKDDTCDLDDGVYFKNNPKNVTGTTLQKWVKEAVEGTTDATPSHKKKCIRVDYKAGYNIDLPVMVFDENTDEHPHLAVKDNNFQDDDPKEFVEYFKSKKTDQMVRIIKYLKAWCDHKREDMPSGLAITVLVLYYYQENNRDDIALKCILHEIHRNLQSNFRCYMPTTPNDNLFGDYTETKKQNFMDNLSNFIKDADSATEEQNQLKASKIWQKHLGDRFPLGKDKDENISNKFTKTIGLSKPYYNE